MKQRPLLALLALLVVGGWLFRAQAAPPSLLAKPRGGRSSSDFGRYLMELAKKYQASFDDGRRLAAAGNHRAAVEQFQIARQVAEQTGRAGFEVAAEEALSWDALGSPERALPLYEIAAMPHSPLLTLDVGQRLTARRDALRLEMSRVRILVASAYKLRLSVDGEELRLRSISTPGPPRRTYQEAMAPVFGGPGRQEFHTVKPGDHEIALSWLEPAAISYTLTVRLEPGERKTLTLDPPPGAEDQAPPASNQSAPAPASPAPPAVRGGGCGCGAPGATR